MPLMRTDSGASAGRLGRTLGTFDLVLLNVVAIVGLRWISTAAQAGPASLVLWILACVVFFIPSGLAVQELSSRIPHEGGLYLWARAAFGETHGFLVGWAYWLVNLVFFPSLLLFISGIVLHIGGGPHPALAESPLYNALACLALLWATTLLNILGLTRAKWLQNVGGLSSIAVAALVVGGGALAWWKFGSATPLDATSLRPHLRSLDTLGTFAILILAYLGLELAPVLGDEIRDASRTIRRALLISGTVICITYIAGTLALLVALPAGQIGLISGIPEALEAIGRRAQLPAFGTISAVLITLAATGGLGAWVTGTARLPFVMGMGHYLPESLARLHPRYGSPYVALLAQAGAASVVLLMAVSGSAIHEAYLLLIDMTICLNCLVWCYLFAALPVLRGRARRNEVGVTAIPGGPLAGWLVAAVGFASTAFACVVSLIPPRDSAHPGLFLLKGVGGCVLILALGLAVCRRGRRRSLPAPAPS